MVVVLTCGSEIWTITKQKKSIEAKVQTAEVNFFRNIAGYTRKEQVRSTKIREELNIFNVSNKILKSRSEWKYHVLRMADRRIQKKIFDIQPNKTTKHRAPTVKMEGPTYSSIGGNRLNTF
jgi:hypothetical protein